MSHRSLVTGGDGFIGSRLVARLVTTGDTAATARPGRALTHLQSLVGSVHVHPLDVTDADALRDFMVTWRPTRVFHLAAAGVTPGLVTPADAVAVNVLGTYNVLAAIRAAGTVERAVFVGSWYEYGYGLNDSPRHPRPQSAYGVSKLAATLLVQSAAAAGHVPAVVVRPFQVYGPGESPHRLIPQIVRGAKEGVPVRLQHPDVTRDWVFVDDVVDAFLGALQAAPGVEPIDIGTGVETSVRNVARLASELLGCPLIDDQPSTGTERSDQYLSGAADTRQAERLFGWKAKLSLADGLRKMIDAN